MALLAWQLWQKGGPVDGGRVAARGFQYQYLRTLEHLVALIDQPDIDCVRVEGPPESGGTVDQVDFDVVAADSAVRLAVQVKSKTAGASMSGAAALGILLQMSGSAQDAQEYVLLTNGRPGAKSQQLDEALSAATEPTDLRRMLVELLHDAPKRRSQVEALDGGGLARLARCRVEYDPRDDAEIREQLRDALRDIRNRAQQGLGGQSAGLLTGYLISEVLQRAADETGGSARFSVEHLRALVLVDGVTLASASGAHDWGTVVGSLPAIPEVARPELLAPLLAAFPLTKDTVTRRATLVGASGIGKSSAAALYVAARADAYDLIAWIACETQYATRASFQKLLATLSDAQGVGADLPEEQLRHKVHAALGRLPGRWLLVCDNAESVRTVYHWIPSLGRGDVIITTLNAASHPGGGALIQVSAMQRGESTELLRRNLHLSEDEQHLWADALDRLAAGLEDWPLALHLGAGYMRATSIGLDQVDHYLQVLKMRSIAYKDAIPPGYPKTLAAVFNLCIDRLEARAQPEKELDLPTIALQMLFASAYLASHQIPAHLLLAAALCGVEEAGDDHLAMVLVSPELVPLGEALGELNRFSLIRNDIALAPTYGQDFPGTLRTITVNTISQALVRDRHTGRPSHAELVDRLLGHAERWISRPMRLGELERVQVMQSHMDTMLAHIENVGMASERVALVYGNLAGAYSLQGHTWKAEELLLAELRHLARCNPDETVLTTQTRFSLAVIYIRSQGNQAMAQSILKTTFDEAVHHLEAVLHQARQWALEQPQAALKLAVDARTLIENAVLLPTESRQLSSLATAFTDLESRIAPTSYSRTRARIEHAERHLQQHEYLQAERCCRDILDENPSGPEEVDTRRRLIEALARQGKWTEAHTQVRYWKEDPAGPRLYRAAIVELIRNAGHACVEHLLAGDHASVHLLRELVGWPDLDTFLAAGDDEDRRFIAQLRSLTSLLG